MSDFIVGIDIGSSKICTIIGKIGKDSRLDVAGKGLSESSGLKKGIIVDIEKASAAVAASVKEAETMAGLKISSAYVNIQGMHVKVLDKSATLNTSGVARKITKGDVDSLLISAADITVPEDWQLIDITPRQFRIDGYDEISEPVGMMGTNLEVEANILAGKITSVQNIIRSMERAGLEIDGIIAEAFAVSEVLLTSEEKETGIMIIDVGGSVTDVSVFKDGKLVFYDSIPIGGDHITNDIAIGLKISTVEAEKIKRMYELALTSLIKNDQECTVYDMNEGKKKNVKVSEIVEIIEARVYEIFSIVKKQTERSCPTEDLLSGIILTGAGISYVDGNREIAENVFSIPVRVAKINQMGLNKPEYITAAGMIKYIANFHKENSKTIEPKASKFSKSATEKGFLGKLGNVFKKMF